ncbi:uncharacterized protein BDW70DRAFT_134931 [Aspergillus foveolatus]|uniref:uncharacterized protein n=1 Tax=Aspergillus foveolatus TaxID=210207 RepID=UPI003CCD5843
MTAMLRRLTRRMLAARQKHRMERVPPSEYHNARFNTAWRLMWLLMGYWGHVASLEESSGLVEQTHVLMLGVSISDAIDGSLRTRNTHGPRCSTEFDWQPIPRFT